MSPDLDLSKLSHAEKDALILTLSARLDWALKLIAELQARIDELTRPGKTPGNSSVPPSKGQKANLTDKPARKGPRAGRPVRDQRPGHRELGEPHCHGGEDEASARRRLARREAAYSRRRRAWCHGSPCLAECSQCRTLRDEHS